MLSGKLAHLIEEHSEQIVKATLRHINDNPNLKCLSSLSDSETGGEGEGHPGPSHSMVRPRQREALVREHEESGEVRSWSRGFHFMNPFWRCNFLEIKPWSTLVDK